MYFLIFFKTIAGGLKTFEKILQLLIAFIVKKSLRATIWCFIVHSDWANFVNVVNLYTLSFGNFGYITRLPVSDIVSSCE